MTVRSKGQVAARPPNARVKRLYWLLLSIEHTYWAAAGFKETLLRWKMKPEVVHGE